MKILGAIPFVMLAFALLWYSALVIRFPPAGALGDDPATYVLMARDLVERGTVVHEFPLFTKLYNQNLSWDAFITPGYHIVRETGWIAPNFAFGFPLLLAFAYRVFGENAMYWVTPLLGALTLVATFALGNELLRELPAPRRRIISALAAFVLAASPKQIQLVLVPMSDVPTQLFCVLALWGALRVMRETQRVFSANASGCAAALKTLWVLYVIAALCGFALGIAYLIRHSAFAMFVPLGLVMTRWGEYKRERARLVFVALLFFVLTILPDVMYRANVLGNAFAVESPESAQMNFYDAPRQFLEMLAALFSVTGFGPLLLLVPFGWWILTREKISFAALVLAAWIFAFMLLHAPLRLTGVFENSLRYLLPAYPAIAISIAFGFVTLWEWAWRAFRPRRKPYQVRLKPNRWEIALLGAIAASFWLAIALRAVISPERFVARAYGWMSAEARRDLETLNAQLPRDAVFGTSDQMAGAVMLYARREIFRPGAMRESKMEFERFAGALQARPIFFLGEWNCPETASASERLPQWLADLELQRVEMEIRDLPYECAQSVRALKME